MVHIIKKIRFLDSYRFTLKSLSDITKSTDDFPILKQEFNDNISLLKQKGFYPYEYIDSIERLKEKQLPPIDKFYSTLTQKQRQMKNMNMHKKYGKFTSVNRF